MKASQWFKSGSVHLLASVKKKKNTGYRARQEVRGSVHCKVINSLIIKSTLRLILILSEKLKLKMLYKLDHCMLVITILIRTSSIYSLSLFIYLLISLKINYKYSEISNNFSEPKMS